MVNEIVNVFTSVFTSYVAPLAKAILDSFTGLFVETGAEGAVGLTVLGEACLTFAAMGVVGSAIYVVINIIRTRSKKNI